MRSRVFSQALVSILAVVALGILFPMVALAHEPRDLGKYHVLVGWVNEPAIQGQPNAISILITDKATGQPVMGAEKTLKVDVAYGGGQPKTMDLEASDDVKGLYTASFIPTKAGSYVFTFTGSIGGQPVNARFESGPNTFDDVTPPEPMEFPVAVPSTASLAQQVQTADANAQSARLFGLGGIAAGVVGTILAGASLLGRRAPRPDAVGETPRATSTNSENR